MLDAQMIAGVRHVAARVSGLLGSPVYGRDDVAQSILLRIVERTPRFDPRLASARTWARLIARHEAASMIAKARAEKRDCRLCTSSLNEPAAIGQAGENILLDSSISADVYNLKLGRQSRPAEELLNLQVDVKRVLSLVRPGLARFARLLTHESVIDAARSTGISRATAHRRVQELRNIFEQNGLDAYATPHRLVGMPRLQRTGRKNMSTFSSLGRSALPKGADNPFSDRDSIIEGHAAKETQLVAGGAR
jgi:RNA polymerase sigma-70 factor (ECF subfamily)